MKTNRLEPEYLKEWQQNYAGLFRCFEAGTVTLFEAIETLRHLGFKDEALKIEITELHKAKREAKGPALQLVVP